MDKEIIKNIISNNLSAVVGDGCDYKVIVADDSYLPAEETFVLNAITTDPQLSGGSYETDVFDCDDYVMYLKTKLSLYAHNNKLGAPLALGFLLTDRHAFNFFINAAYDLCLINTQSNDRATTSEVTQFAAFLDLDSSNTIQLLYI